MRKKVIGFGYKIPCDSCENRNTCYKDVNIYDYFILFDCGDIRPTLATSQTAGEEEA